MFPVIDRTFEQMTGTAAPGVVYGVLVDGQLVDARGFGSLQVESALRPDADSIFRIASMTKSFTAAAILLLRDEGVLRLQDPVENWFPEMARSDIAPDDPPISIEQLLTMSSGLPTDDPWGDRQQGLDLRSFADLIRGGFRSAWVPGTRFEYSNLGYGILGRVISAASGLEYRDYVSRRLLAPLGMDSTTFSHDEVDPERLARGYVRRDDTWLEEPIDGYGALASMGGVFTSIRDLARWVAGFADAFAPPDRSATGHPLSRATRREMQQIHRATDPEVEWSAAAARPTLVAGGYGYGLFVFEDQSIGRTIGHGGGYPGFGSHMRWHPGSGVGVLAFGNARYVRMGVAVIGALRSLVVDGVGRDSRVRPWPETLAARARIESLLERWDDDVAARLFAMNVELDEPLERRRAAIDHLRSVHGALAPDVAEEPSCDDPPHLAWWMRGERGRVLIEIRLDPESSPRVQSLVFTSVPEPPEGLTAIADRVIAACARPGPAWPDDLRLASSLDPDTVGRELRATEALFGPLTLGPSIRGDGRTTAAWRADGSRGGVELELSHDPATGDLDNVAFRPRRIRVPIQAS
jgi:serine-type D-Ala-D-Ala carboxypeptidase/endopeptidase